MQFKTQYDEEEIICSEPGSGEKIEYQLRIVGDNMECVETGKTSLYDYIQSHADSVDLDKILERCAMIEDYSLLNRMPVKFMDITDMPKTLCEAYAQVQDAHNFFDRMPTDIKESYNNNFLQFIESIGSKKFENVVTDYLNTLKEQDTKKESVTDGES